MSSFDIAAWKRKDRGISAVPPISHASQLTCWTRTSIRAPDGQQYLYGDNSGLLPFTSPRLPLNLNAGFPEQFVQKSSIDGSGVELIVHGAVAAHVAWPPNGVCSFRNNLNKIAGTLLPNSEPWVIDAILLSGLPHSSSSGDSTATGGDAGKEGGSAAGGDATAGGNSGVLFLDIVKTPEKSYPGMDKFMYYGYKFESICTGGSGSPEEVVDSTSEFGAVLCLQLGGHNILMAAEMDGYDPTGAGGSVPSYVEMKTYNVPTKPAARANFYAKYAKWWIQSFLGGVPNLILGGRDARGFLTEVKKVPVHSLPSAAAAAGHPFDCWQLMRFTEQVLAWMRSCCASAPEQQLRFEFSPERGSISCRPEEGSLRARVSAALGIGAGAV